MLRNYLRVAARTLTRQKGYTLINVFGLSVGIACCLLIGRWVQFELSYDEFHAGADRTFRVIKSTGDGWENRVGGALAPLMSENLPAVEKTVQLTRDGDMSLSRAGRSQAGPPKRFKEPSFVFADSAFFDVFDFPLAAGNPDAALSRPGTVVLTSNMATKYFGTEDPVGQTLTLHANVYGESAERTLTVTGVLKTLPENTHLAFDFLASMATFKQIVGLPVEVQFPGFAWPNTSTYVRLGESASAKAVGGRLAKLIERRGGAPAETTNYTARLQPITGIHLQDLAGEVRARGSQTTVYIFSAIAVFTLLLACINFINLSTARSARRAKEVGVRKVAGARREQLVGQFLGESMLLTLLALAGGVALTELLLPVFNAVAERSLTLGYATNGALWVGLAAVALFVGLVAGGYPAAVLSRFRPADVLSGGSYVGAASGERLRKGLVVFQFAISVALIAGTLIAYQQFDYMQSARLGFEEERVLAMPASDDYEALKAEVRLRSGVQAVTGANARPGLKNGSAGQYETAPFENTVRALADRPTMIRQEVDYGFFEAMDIEVVAGRAFSKAFSDEGRRTKADSTQYFDFAAPVRGRSFVINESAAERLGWTPQEALGKKLRFFATDEGRFYSDVGGSVVGVVEDYHAASLRTKIKPMAFTLGGNEYLLAKMASGGNAEGVVSGLRAAWEEVSPQVPFEVSFLDRALDAQYRAERRLSRIIGLFALVAVGVACLGLFGLAAHAAERRRKEIGIRKAMGASAASVVALLSKDFLKLVGVGFVLAVPPAWYGMQRWLEGFAYRIDLGPLVFAGAGALALLIALAATGTQALRAARTNPAEVLRDE
jgi:putative ABC transport system permease protein